MKRLCQRFRCMMVWCERMACRFKLYFLLSMEAWRNKRLVDGRNGLDNEDIND